MLAWSSIRTVFLDMDGTLLDLRYDNYFWQEHVPLRYAERHGLPLVQAKEELVGRYNAARGRLQWYCVDHWTQELGLDIAALKQEIAHMVRIRPSVEEFLAALKVSRKRSVLLTNAHRKSVDIKFEQTGLHSYFDRIISSHDFGEPKEAPAFWQWLIETEAHDPAATLLIDDSLNVLEAAHKAGVGHVLSIHQPDSGAPPQQAHRFHAITDFRELLPIS